jgi:hypothetical protein
MGVDDDLGPAEGARCSLRKIEENRAEALPLRIPADADEAKAGLRLVDEIDAHRAHDLAIADEHMREIAGLEFVRVAFVVGLPRQQRSKDRVPADRMIGDPLLRRLYGPQRIALTGIGHLGQSLSRSRLPV